MSDNADAPDATQLRIKALEDENAKLKQQLSLLSGHVKVLETRIEHITGKPLGPKPESSPSSAAKDEPVATSKPSVASDGVKAPEEPSAAAEPAAEPSSTPTEANDE
eukprot:m.12385 g.12385  ORF g.12385 m.12385 type:complete len:107 (+) comp9937_c0_seq3:97-417(+)